MILICENSLKAEQEESIKQEEPIEQEESKLNPSNLIKLKEKENESKSMLEDETWTYYVIGAIPIVFVFIFIICFIIKRLKTKSIHTSSSEEVIIPEKTEICKSNKTIIPTVISQACESNRSSKSEESKSNASEEHKLENKLNQSEEENTILTEQNKVKEEIKEEIKEVINLLLEFDENSTQENTELDLQIRTHIENIKKNIKGENYLKTYEANIQYAAYSNKNDVCIFFNQNKDGLSVFCYAKNITIKVTVDQVNEEIVFENGRRAEFSDMSIEEMKGHINTFFGK